MKTSIACQIVVLCFAAVVEQRATAGDPIEIEFELDAGQYDRVDVPVCVPIKLEIPVREVRSASIRGPVARLPAQVTAPSLLATDTNANAEAHFILPLLRAGQKRT
jgi:hypothetical protein